MSEWLDFIQTRHPRAIDLTLERVATVHRRLGCPRPAPTVIVVGGTNGKGSCVALLESILSEAGHRVGAYTSPHLLRFNERLRIDRRDSADDAWEDALRRVDRARGDDPLTYFEFITLAAVEILAAGAVDVAVLEVGLGGRLDAVNAIAADAALISAVDIDHTDWLGRDRDSIGREKAGIFHRGKIAVCGDRDPPPAVPDRAAQIGARYYQAGRDFDAAAAGDEWTWRGPDWTLSGLPLPALPGRFQLDNAAACLMVLAGLGLLAELAPDALARGLRRVTLPGRLQRIREAPEVIVDVAHNPLAARAVADWLGEHPARGAQRVVLGMLQTKDAAGFTAELAPLVARWYLATLPVERGMASAELARRLPDGSSIDGCFDRVEAALEAALKSSEAQDRVIVLGSFHTAAAALRHLAGPDRAAASGR